MEKKNVNGEILMAKELGMELIAFKEMCTRSSNVEAQATSTAGCGVFLTLRCC